MEIQPKWEFVEGSFDTKDTKMVCLVSNKYKEVQLSVKSNGNKGMNLSFATIKLYSRDRLSDASETFEDASKLGYEIERRWNEFNDKK